MHVIGENELASGLSMLALVMKTRLTTRTGNLELVTEGEITFGGLGCGSM